MFWKCVVDLTQYGVLALPIGLHQGIARILNPIAVVAGSADHPVGLTPPVQVITALRPNQLIPKFRALQETAGRHCREMHAFNTGQNLGGHPTRSIGKEYLADRQQAGISRAEERQFVLRSVDCQHHINSVFRLSGL